MNSVVTRDQVCFNITIHNYAFNYCNYLLEQSEISWYFNRKPIVSGPDINIDVAETKTSLSIVKATNEHVGFYLCKAINDLGDASTMGKFDVASSTSQPVTLTEMRESKDISVIDEKKTKTVITQNIESSTIAGRNTQKSMKNEVNASYQNYEEKTSKQTIVETIENNEMKIQKEINFSVKEVSEELFNVIDLADIVNQPEISKSLESLNDFGPGTDTLKELVVIDYLMKRGSSTEDIKNIYNSNGFTALKQPESQFALVQLIEREGHGKIISEILVAEHITDDELLASTVGFHALMKMIELNHTTVEEVITHLSSEDFVRQEWKSIESKEVLI